MATAAGITSIQSFFQIAPEEMPKMSTATSKPNYTTIKKFLEALEQNAMSIPSTQSELGHLALVISDTDYTIANEGTPWKDPTNPGNSPTNPVPTTALTSTGVATRSTSEASTEPNNQAITMLPFTAAEAIRAFNEEQQEHRRFLHARTALRNLILNAIDDKYICKLRHSRTHYALVPPYRLIEHIQTTYGTVDDQDRAENEDRMKTTWDTNEPIETIFQQLKDGQDFAKAGEETISDGQLVRWGYTIIHNTQLFNNDCKKWRQLPANTRTWEKFVTFFTAADDDRRKSTTSPSTTGDVYTANQVQEILQNEIAAVIAQMQKGDDKENQQPEQHANSTQGLKAQEVQAMIKEALKEQTNNGDDEYRGGRRKFGQKKNAKCQPAQAIVDGYPVSYCWSHGVTRNLFHTSMNCSRKKEGHKDNATYHQRMGGSDEVQKPRK